MNSLLDFGRVGPQKPQNERKQLPKNVPAPPRHRAMMTNHPEGLVNVGGFRRQLLVQGRRDPAPQPQRRQLRPGPR
jgi:hypothetical protein